MVAFTLCFVYFHHNGTSHLKALPQNCIEVSRQLHARTALSPVTEALVTPWSGVLLEKLIVTQLVKKLPSFMEPDDYLPFNSARHLSPF